jgi:hypothetical protein
MSASSHAFAANDSLPYVDKSHQGYEEYAATLVEQEMKRLAPRTVEPLPPMRFRSRMMQGEVERLAADRASPTISSDTNASELTPPDQDTVSAWEDAVRRAKIAYEKERLRKTLLKLSKDGAVAEQWKQMNALLDKLKSDLEQELQQQKGRVDAVNLQRQEEQQKMGHELHVLSTQYEQLVQKTKQLKEAIAEMK